MLYQTFIRIHLENIRFNIEGIRNIIGKQRKILLAIKANAYGHGAVEVARIAQEINVEYLGVATIPEGIELRSAGIYLPILKFSPTFPEEMEAALQNEITFTVCDQDNVQSLQSIAQQTNTIARVHLKIDTGMGRIGVQPEDALNLASFIVTSCPNLVLEGIYTHLPVSDAADPVFTLAQIKRFKKIVDLIQDAIGFKVSLVHCANSGGILGHPESWFDMVRPGILVYGYYPDPETPRTIPLKPVLSFYTKVTFLKRVKQGTSIGYGRTWVAPNDTWIATISVGYADGFNRLFSNSGRVLIGGNSYPIVGRVCMDQSMVDLGAQTDICVGDDVTLIGKDGNLEITCDEWAEKLHTIPYEITCQINARVTRTYSSE